MNLKNHAMSTFVQYLFSPVLRASCFTAERIGFLYIG